MLPTQKIKKPSGTFTLREMLNIGSLRLKELLNVLANWGTCKVSDDVIDNMKWGSTNEDNNRSH